MWSADYDTIHDLAAAAKARHQITTAAKKVSATANQGALQKEREKKKEAKNHSILDDPNAIIQGDGDDFMVQATFQVCDLPAHLLYVLRVRSPIDNFLVGPST